MSKFYTTDTLIESVLRRASIPLTNITFEEVDFLAFANEEMDLGIIPHVLTFHEEYFVRTDLVTLEPNVNRYQIPSRAVGGKLRELAYQDNGGNIFEMSRVKVDDIATYQNNVIQSGFTLFYVEGDEICLLPLTGNNPTGFLRFSYYLRPNEIVSQSRVSIVTNVNRVTGEISVDKVPDNITFGDVLDIVQTKSPHRTLKVDVTPMAIDNAGKTFTFDLADIPSNLVPGDQIALAEETIVPQIPTDLHSMLSQRVAARCLESMGDAAGLQAANVKLTEMEQKTGTIIQDRVEGASLKVVNKHSSLKRNKLYWRR